MGSIDCVRQCLRNTKKVLPLLKEIASRDFFSFYALDTMTPCMYFPTEDEGCDLDRCEITAVSDRDVPPALLERDLNEYDFRIDGWSRKHMPSCFTRYFDLRTCQSRDTGYDGSRVWRFIHTKICFNKRLDDPASHYKRDYNRAISGMHAAVHAEILNDLGLTKEGCAEYRRRLRDEPGAITNLYFAYMLTLCALHDCRARLDTCGYLGDGEIVRPLMQQLTSAELLSETAVQRASRNLRSHAASSSAEVWRMRMRHRDLTQMMGCVQCDLCRVHGTVMCLGLGATMQVPACLHADRGKVARRLRDGCHCLASGLVAAPDLSTPWRDDAGSQRPPFHSFPAVLSACRVLRLQVLLGSDGRGGDHMVLDRVQVASLVTTAAKFGAACETVERFRDFDGESELGGTAVGGAIAGEAAAKAAWLAKLDTPAWGLASGAAPM